MIIDYCKGWNQPSIPIGPIDANSLASLNCTYFFQILAYYMYYENNAILLKPYIKKIMLICKCNWQHWKIFKNVRWIEITIIRIIASIFLLIILWMDYAMLKVQCIMMIYTNLTNSCLIFIQRKMPLIVGINISSWAVAVTHFYLKLAWQMEKND